MSVQKVVGHVRLERAVACAFADLFVALVVGATLWVHIAGENDMLAVGCPHSVGNSRRKMRQLRRLTPIERKKPRLTSFFAR